MAKATKNVVTTTTVTLELTEKEANRLRTLLGELPISSGTQPSLYNVFQALEKVTPFPGLQEVLVAYHELRPEA